MNVTLELANTSGPLVEVTFVNEAEEHQYLALPRIEPDNMDGSYFEFLPPAVPFLGIQVKRRPYAAEELLELSPGESLSRTYNLGTLYDLTSVAPTRVRYRATHPTSGLGKPALLESHWLALRDD